MELAIAALPSDVERLQAHQTELESLLYVEASTLIVHVLILLEVFPQVDISSWVIRRPN